MSKTESNMLPLGTLAPKFQLKDVCTGLPVGLNDQHPATVILFICNHCPYVKHINSQLVDLANDYMSRNVRFLAINSNNVENYPDDSPANMKIAVQTHKYPFPYLFDETQEVAKAYNAACTPDFFVFNKKLALIYRGQLDDSRPGNNIPVSGHSIREALNCILENRILDVLQKPSIGCNIKWK